MTPTIPQGFAANLADARAIECAASAAPGAYGAAVPVPNVQPGLYLVVTSNPAALRDSDSTALRSSATRQLEVPFRADVPMVVWLQAGACVAAAYGAAAAVVWLIPLKPIC